MLQGVEPSRVALTVVAQQVREVVLSSAAEMSRVTLVLCCGAIEAGDCKNADRGCNTGCWGGAGSGVSCCHANKDNVLFWCMGACECPKPTMSLTWPSVGECLRS